MEEYFIKRNVNDIIEMLSMIEDEELLEDCINHIVSNTPFDLEGDDD